MIPDERAWRYHQRLAAATREKPLGGGLLTAHSLRNLAREVEKTTPRSEWIASAIRALADDVETRP